MSFKIRLTHKLLEPQNKNPPPQENTYTTLIKGGTLNGKKKPGDPRFEKSYQKPQEKIPVSSGSGFVIHTVGSAQADHL